MKRSAFAALGLLLASLALAQSPNAFHGTWKVTWQGTKKVNEAKLQLAMEDSSWQIIGPGSSKDDPCGNRKAPVTLEPRGETQAVLKIRYSEVLAGCTDRTVRMTLTSPGSAKGQRGSTELEMVKE